MEQGSFSKDNERGVYRGIVVNSDDPLMLGRVQVRVPTMHGETSEIPDRSLPWGSLCSPSASYNAGSYLVPEKGSAVWVAFENGDRDKPIVIGGCYGRGKTEPSKYRETDETYVDQNGRSVPARHHNVPVEALADKSARVVYKSAKGHVLVMYDGDGAEGMELSDANGQCLMFRSPLKKGKGKLKGTSPKSSLAGESILNLSNALGQMLGFMSDGAKCVMNFVDKIVKRGLILDEQERIRIVHQKNEGNKVEIQIKEGEISLLSKMGRIRILSEEGKVQVEGMEVELIADNLKIRANNIEVNGNMKVTGNIKSTGTVSGVLLQTGKGANPTQIEIEELEMEDWGVSE